MLIAQAIWKYQEADRSFGDFDAVDMSDGMAHLVKNICVDEAECIRKVILESPVLRERMIALPRGDLRGIEDKGESQS